MNKKRILGFLLVVLTVGIIWNPISDWVLNLVQSLLGLYALSTMLEMPHKFYGMAILLFISWKMLEAVLSLVGKMLMKGLELSSNRKTTTSEVKKDE